MKVKLSHFATRVAGIALVAGTATLVSGCGHMHGPGHGPEGLQPVFAAFLDKDSEYVLIDAKTGEKIPPAGKARIAPCGAGAGTLCILLNDKQLQQSLNNLDTGATLLPVGMMKVAGPKCNWWYWGGGILWKYPPNCDISL